ncbi:hypothetical protein D5086_023334 [Populus alba]|uniref:Uncharacterized protein n=1 Tax=Populus alba TaxID=43335 RepID=A0ACC4B9F6_POPAL
MVRPPCCDRLNVKRGLWTAEEDAKMLAHVSKHGTGNWTAVPKKAEQYPFTPEGISNINSHLMTTTVPPKMEPNQECFSNNMYNNDANDNHSLDLLDQLQAIRLLKKNSQQALAGAIFLLEDEYLPGDHPRAEQENAAEFSSKDLKNQTPNPNVMIPQSVQSNTEVGAAVNGMDLALQSNTGSDDRVASSSPQHSSFVETIMDGESKIFLDFPNLLEEIFYN